METKMPKANATKKVEPKEELKKLPIEKKELQKTEKPHQNNPKIDAILGINAENRIKKMETFGIISDKYLKLKSKTDDLTNFRAGNDQTQSKLEFVSQSGYKFSVSNESVIDEVLNVIETKLFSLLESAENQVLTFNI